MRKRKIRHTYDNLRPEYKEAIEDALLERNLIGPFKTAEEAVAAMLEDEPPADPPRSRLIPKAPSRGRSCRLNGSRRRRSGLTEDGSAEHYRGATHPTNTNHSQETHHAPHRP